MKPRRTFQAGQSPAVIETTSHDDYPGMPPPMKMQQLSPRSGLIIVACGLAVIAGVIGWPVYTSHRESKIEESLHEVASANYEATCHKEGSLDYRSALRRIERAEARARTCGADDGQIGRASENGQNGHPGN